MTMTISSIHAVRELLAALLLPLYDYEPGYGFQQSRQRAQTYEGANICPPPFVFRVQNIQTLEDIVDAQTNHGVSSEMMIDVPVESVLVIRLWPQKQSQHLHNRNE